MSNYAQSHFISNWNKIGTILNGQHFSLNPLPILDTNGVCNGLDFVLLNYLELGKEDVFFKIYNFICDNDVLRSVAWIKSLQSPDKIIGNPEKILQFIIQLNLLQNSQSFSPSELNIKESRQEKERRILYKEGNFTRVGKKIIKCGMLSVHYPHSLEFLFNNLCEGEALILGISYLKQGHNVLAYKKNGIHIFDSNVGKLQSSETKQQATRYLINRINHLIQGLFPDLIQDVKVLSFLAPVFKFFQPSLKVSEEELSQKCIESDVYLRWAKCRFAEENEKTPPGVRKGLV